VIGAGSPRDLEFAGRARPGDVPLDGRPEPETRAIKHLVAVPEKHRCFYPEGHHLLMYDVQKEKVIADIGTWLSDLPERLAQKKSKDTRSANRR
jgi:hypothetical protein